MSNLLSRLRTRIWGKVPPPARPLPPFEPEPEEITVPEVTVAELQAALTHGLPPLLLDVREPWEWRQVHMDHALHIPMNDVPERLSELPGEQTIVVICAHGSRSYGVAGYLIEQGYRASSLAGGITQWAHEGGAISR